MYAIRSHYDGKGRTVDFTNTVIIMTSNIASDIIQAYDEKSKDKEKMEADVFEVVRSSFRPEFLNRIDQIILFNKLGNRITSYNVCYTKLLRCPTIGIWRR